MLRVLESADPLTYYGAGVEGNLADTLRGLWDSVKEKPLARYAAVLAVNPDVVDDTLLAADLPAELTTSSSLPKHLAAVIIGVVTERSNGTTAVVRNTTDADDRRR